jgi:hypothetical protein
MVKYAVPSTYISALARDESDVSSIASSVHSLKPSLPNPPSAPPSPSSSWALSLWTMGICIGVLGLLALSLLQYQCDIPTNEELNLTVQYALESERLPTSGNGR